MAGSTRIVETFPVHGFARPGSPGALLNGEGQARARAWPPNCMLLLFSRRKSSD
jgi:hypothetical protein